MLLMLQKKYNGLFISIVLSPTVYTKISFSSVSKSTHPWTKGAEKGHRKHRSGINQLCIVCQPFHTFSRKIHACMCVGRCVNWSAIVYIELIN